MIAVIATIAEEWFPYTHDRNDCWGFFPAIAAIVATIWKPAFTDRHYLRWKKATYNMTRSHIQKQKGIQEKQKMNMKRCLKSCLPSSRATHKSNIWQKSQLTLPFKNKCNVMSENEWDVAHRKTVVGKKKPWLSSEWNRVICNDSGQSQTYLEMRFKEQGITTP